MIARLCFIGADGVAFRAGDGLQYGGTVDELQLDTTGAAIATSDGHTIRRRTAYQPLFSDKGVVSRIIHSLSLLVTFVSIYIQSTGQDGCTRMEAAGRTD
jgi:hypothetical protein